MVSRLSVARPAPSGERLTEPAPKEDLVHHCDGLRVAGTVCIVLSARVGGVSKGAGGAIEAGGVVRSRSNRCAGIWAGDAPAAPTCQANHSRMRKQRPTSCLCAKTSSAPLS